MEGVCWLDGIPENEVREFESWTALADFGVHSQTNKQKMTRSNKTRLKYK